MAGILSRFQSGQVGLPPSSCLNSSPPGIPATNTAPSASTNGRKISFTASKVSPSIRISILIRTRRGHAARHVGGGARREGDQRPETAERDDPRQKEDACLRSGVLR